MVVGRDENELRPNERSSVETSIVHTKSFVRRPREPVDIGDETWGENRKPRSHTQKNVRGQLFVRSHDRDTVCTHKPYWNQVDQRGIEQLRREFVVEPASRLYSLLLSYIATHSTRSADSEKSIRIDRECHESVRCMWDWRRDSKRKRQVEYAGHLGVLRRPDTTTYDRQTPVSRNVGKDSAR